MKKILTIIALFIVIGANSQEVKTFVNDVQRKLIVVEITDTINGDTSKLIMISNLNESQLLIVDSANAVCYRIADTTITQPLKYVTYTRQDNMLTIQNYETSYQINMKELEALNPADKLKIDMLGYLCLIYKD